MRPAVRATGTGPVPNFRSAFGLMSYTLAMFLMVASVLAAPVDLVADDAVRIAASGRCAEVESRLERRAERNPDDLAARLALDACRISGTERTTGERDLASLFHVGAPFEPAMLAKEKLAAADAARLREDAQLGAAMVIRAFIKLKAYSSAQRAWVELEPQVGSCGAMDAAKVAIEHSQNGTATGWRTAKEAFERYPDSLDVLDEVGLLVFADAAPASAALLDAVLVRGKPTAKLNVFYGLARTGRGAECLTRLERVSFAEEWKDELLKVRYRCATAAGDLAAADAVTAGGWDGLDPRLRGEHAALRLAAGRPADALDLVRGIEGLDARSTEVTVRALTALGKSAELVAFAKGLPLGSIPRLAAAVTLYNAGDTAKARELILGGCAAYEAENAALCVRMEGP